MGDFFVMPDNESCNSKENNVQVSQPECGLLLTASTILFFSSTIFFDSRLGCCWLQKKYIAA